MFITVFILRAMSISMIYLKILNVNLIGYNKDTKCEKLIDNLQNERIDQAGKILQNFTFNIIGEFSFHSVTPYET